MVKIRFALNQMIWKQFFFIKTEGNSLGNNKKYSFQLCLAIGSNLVERNLVSRNFPTKIYNIYFNYNIIYILVEGKIHNIIYLNT